LATGIDRSTALIVTGGGSTALGPDTARLASLSISGGGSVTLAHSASWGDAKSGTLSVTGGGSVSLAHEPQHVGVVLVSGGGSVAVVGQAEQGAIAAFATLNVSGGGGVTISTILPSVDQRGIHASIAVEAVLSAGIALGGLRGSITPGGGMSGDIDEV
jgi:hypothetical protein